MRATEKVLQGVPKKPNLKLPASALCSRLSNIVLSSRLCFLLSINVSISLHIIPPSANLAASPSGRPPFPENACNAWARFALTFPIFPSLVLIHVPIFGGVFSDSYFRDHSGCFPFSAAVSVIQLFHIIGMAWISESYSF